MNSTKDKQTLKQRIEKNLTLSILLIVIASFGAGWVTYEMFLSISDRYMKKDYVYNNFIDKADCIKKERFIYITNGDSSTTITGEEKVKINNKIQAIEKMVTQESEIDYTKLTNEQKYTFVLSELDIIYGQLRVFEKIINGGNIKSLNDSLNSLFDLKYKEFETNYNK